MGKTVCFTGHRMIPKEQYAQLKARLDNAIEEAVKNGAVCFRTGGARGFDTLAALCVLSARVRHKELRLELILPCPSQPEGWPPSEIEIYGQILSMADSVRYVSQFFHSGVMHARNRALVEGADLCIAYLSTSHSGTAYTASYAMQKGVDFINLADEI
ncbi:MAG: DUF1273 family protein [Clostridia bacterium]|nr:DUF1273 family protein [Clostridia bacterium]